MLEIQNVSKTFNAGTVNEKTALNGLNLKQYLRHRHGAAEQPAPHVFASCVPLLSQRTLSGADAFGCCRQEADLPGVR